MNINYEYTNNFFSLQWQLLPALGGCAYSHILSHFVLVLWFFFFSHLFFQYCIVFAIGGSVFTILLH